MRKRGSLLLIALIVFLGAVGSLLAGCAGILNPGAPSPVPTRAATLAPSPTLVPVPTSAVSNTPPAMITLTIWSIPLFDPGEPTLASKMLAEQAAAFTQAYPNYRLDWVIKPPVGAGNALDFLRAAHNVAPAVLPDIIVLNGRDLATAARAGLVQPIDNLLSEAVKTDLYPFARNMVSIDGMWYGLPFEASIEHLIYDTKAVDAAPLTWSDVLSDELRYAFPAGGENGRVNDMFLIQYLAMGGRLVSSSNQPALDEAPLAAVLSFYADGKRAKLFPLNMIEMRSTEDGLQALISNTVSMCNIRSDVYLSQRAQLKNIGFAALPTWNGTVATIARGSAFALVSSDISRHEAAKAFFDWFLRPAHNGAWTRLAGRLPTRQASMNEWSPSDPYTSFVRWQLAAAYYPPSTPEFDRLYVALQQAVRDVWNGAATPIEAARRTVNQMAVKG